MKIGGWKTRAVFDSYAVASTADLTTAMRKWEAASLQMGKDNVKLTASVEG
jgi:hypothetical protein